MVLNGTTFDDRTNSTVAAILEAKRIDRTRIVLQYGDTETGHSWGDTFSISGYIGRSMGPNKIPLLIHNSRSTGGGGILDYCIVGIWESKGKKPIYVHPKFKASENGPSWCHRFTVLGKESK